MKSLKIPTNGYSESVKRRRTDNTMAIKKNYKRANNGLQNIHVHFEHKTKSNKKNCNTEH